ncbi:phage tail sheath family protein [Bacteroides sp. UBA939]|uniref:phage tail sheath family protein n=1 Tax=Bacteroides sp. UBA939 TaxID=1946092 RepID=UPI0025C62A2B|nr:phage tail sheath C-terminal domain-containing protein [Bacteroides sp. UBA939]
MGEYKTPGVYIVEKNAFGNSVVEVETAVPAFIGYTEKALNGTEELIGKPWKITSMTEFIQYFGGMHTPKYTICLKTGGEESAPSAKSFSVKTSSGSEFSIAVENDYTLYLHMLLFFTNGGGPCYIVSVGKYETEFKAADFETAFTPLEKEAEPTMIVIPEAVNLTDTACYSLQQKMVEHCNKMQSRISILDVFIQKYPADPKAKVDYVENFRNGFSTNFPSYAAAYYPYLNTSALADTDITENMIVLKDNVADFITHLDLDEKMITSFKTAFLTEENSGEMTKDINQALLQNSVIYRQLIKAVKDNLNLLSPSAAIAGVYCSVDNSRGVWKAPANVTVNSVVKPSVAINDYEQENLNIPMSGKAVNAIRTFPGEGVKVWGARTMDGNSQDWRYVNVRRTMIYLEQSVKNAARAYVFEPNDAGTWINMKCMIDNFLRSVWKRGGLAGATPEDAFEVHVGLGDTMTAEDILDGIMRITVLVAVSRPAEFIEITFQQQMQKS